MTLADARPVGERLRAWRRRRRLSQLELAIESFYPADAATAEFLRERAGG